jgi:predicted dehydrogenase
MAGRLGVALVGCGFVADFYAVTLRNYPALEVLGVYDRDGTRARRFGEYFDLPVFPSFDDLLSHPRVEMVLNLTNPGSHFEVSMACLRAGKHVYSEKPLALRMDHARALVDTASAAGLTLSAAPCNLLGESAQTLWRALRRERIGRPLLAYAQLDDGATHRMSFESWAVESGTPWPFLDEFQAGCVLEHAGYYLTWLVAFFGAVTAVTRLTSCLVPDKAVGLEPDRAGPDLSVAVLEHAGGAVSRLTCSTLAPRDHTLTVVGTDGVLKTRDCWHYDGPVRLGASLEPHRWRKVRPVRAFRPRHHYWRKRLRLQRSLAATIRSTLEQWDAHRMDFARGPAEQAQALRSGREPRLSAVFCLHVTEVLLAIDDRRRDVGRLEIQSPCPPLEPMDWAL